MLPSCKLYKFLLPKAHMPQAIVMMIEPSLLLQELMQRNQVVARILHECARLLVTFLFLYECLLTGEYRVVLEGIGPVVNSLWSGTKVLRGVSRNYTFKLPGHTKGLVPPCYRTQEPTIPI